MSRSSVSLINTPLSRSRKKTPVFKVVYYTILILSAIVVIIPFVWMLSGAFDRINTYELPFPPRFIPKNFSLFNFEMVITNMKIFYYMRNTIAVAGISLILQFILAPMAGFAFSKGTFPFKAIILAAILSNMMVPFETKILPLYVMMRSMGLVNSYLGVVLPSVMTNGFFIFLMKKYCDDLPNDLLESAVLDGATKLTIYIRIYLPLIGPALATLAVLDIMNVWNDLLWPMIIINKQEMVTIQVGLAMFASGTDSLNRHAGMASAASVISIVPLSLVFIFLQRYIVQSIAVSGIKQ